MVCLIIISIFCLPSALVVEFWNTVLQSFTHNIIIYHTTCTEIDVEEIVSHKMP